ncbi:2-amino-4-hydroxy-6-hydroxymethyldihydropteridine diphosphokinase [Desulfohalotomaculum tongense]|uniref:2-amino-4-hydroxy-6- hydroxymethyldihydropteridine diphosphokinase n=1 Tax=Desulforadius tongensis TaxID=1216062 RepID=UPI00195B32ED|nr:2-amino-4-hydroxy-6-hydroxymethyldihydropteridine diphosphokinase [Desulforadius tongensis]MBM7856027.1 2-amino-4-hydroxy-6-hydroxymethyldihydropteridine diphosphokinase [Desulforadius tongensis]
MVTAYIGIGSNMGDKSFYINKALDLLHSPPEIKVVKVAPLYRTAPVGYTEQDWFLNTVAQLETVISPQKLLHQLQQIENKLGRERKIRWGPRTIDLDLLIYGDVTLTTPDLTLPHPRMTERAFVMVPLADISPTMAMIGGKTAEELAGELMLVQEIYRAAADVMMHMAPNKDDAL